MSSKGKLLDEKLFGVLGKAPLQARAAETVKRFAEVRTSERGGESGASTLLFTFPDNR